MSIFSLWRCLQYTDNYVGVLTALKTGCNKTSVEFCTWLQICVLCFYFYMCIHLYKCVYVHISMYMCVYICICFKYTCIFQICETYPRELYVPRTASKPIIVGSSKFRSKGRFPVLSYYHKDKKVWSVFFLMSVVWKVFLNTCLLTLNYQ